MTTIDRMVMTTARTIRAASRDQAPTEADEGGTPPIVRYAPLARTYGARANGRTPADRHHRRRIRRSVCRARPPWRRRRRHADRSHESLPVPAPVVPGRDRGAVAGGHRGADPVPAPTAAERYR